MEFFKNIKKSIYSPDYYQELLVKPFSYSLRYYFSFILFLSLVFTLALSFYVIPQVTLFADVVSTKIIAHYPAELKIDVKNGKVSTNVAEPYVISMPQELKDNGSFKVNGSTAKEFKNLMVINTKNDFNIEEFKSYDTAFLLTKDSLVAYGKNGQITIQSFDSNVNFTLDKPTVEYYVNRVRPFVKFLYPIIILLVFLVCLLVLIFQLVYLLFGALLIWLVAKLNKVDMGYAKCYQLGIHLMTLGILIGCVVTLVRFYVGPLYITPFLFTTILIIMAVVNIKKPDQVGSQITSI